MNTRRYIPINSRPQKKHDPENSLGFFEKLDLSRTRFNAVNDSSIRTILVGRFLKRMTSIISMILHVSKVKFVMFTLNLARRFPYPGTLIQISHFQKGCFFQGRCLFYGSAYKK